MAQFVSFVRKEFLHIFRDRRSMLILLGMPVVLLLLFGYAVTTEVRNVRVAVLDHSRDEVTTRAYNRISSNEYMSLAMVTADRHDVDAAFRQGRIDVAVVFGSGFASDIRHFGTAQVQVLVDGTEPNQAAMRLQYVGQVLSAMRNDIVKGGVADAEDCTFSLTPIDVLTDNSGSSGGYDYTTYMYYLLYGYYPMPSTGSSSSLIEVKPAMERPSIVKLELDKAILKLYYSRLFEN